MSLYSKNSTLDKSDKISLDSLYDRKREVDQLRLDVFNKILKRIHAKIIYTSKQRYNEQFLFYVVPEFMIGVPKYNVTHCIVYIIEKLEKNNFIVKYTHPNMLFISWGHYIPSYQRKEIKNKYGIEIDGFGKEIDKKQKSQNHLLLTNKNKLDLHMNNKTSPTQSRNNDIKPKQKDEFKNINTYKSEGIYNDEYLKVIRNKFNK
jgi:hypothetical protein